MREFVDGNLLNLNNKQITKITIFLPSKSLTFNELLTVSGALSTHATRPRRELTARTVHQGYNVLQYLTQHTVVFRARS